KYRQTRGRGRPGVAAAPHRNLPANPPVPRRNCGPGRSRISSSMRPRGRRWGRFGGDVMLRHIASAIAFALALASAPARADAPPAGRAGRPVVEVVFVLDTTGSMGPLIEGAKRKIWSIATAII